MIQSPSQTASSKIYTPPSAQSPKNCHKKGPQKLSLELNDDQKKMYEQLQMRGLKKERQSLTSLAHSRIYSKNILK